VSKCIEIGHRAQMLRKAAPGMFAAQEISDVGDGTRWARANAAMTPIKTVKMKSFISMCFWSHAIEGVVWRRAGNAPIARSVPTSKQQVGKHCVT